MSDTALEKDIVEKFFGEGAVIGRTDPKIRQFASLFQIDETNITESTKSFKGSLLSINKIIEGEKFITADLGQFLDYAQNNQAVAVKEKVIALPMYAMKSLLEVPTMEGRERMCKLIVEAHALYVSPAEELLNVRMGLPKDSYNDFRKNGYVLVES